MNKKAGILLIVVGLGMLLAAGGLYLHNVAVDANAGREAEAILTQVQEAIPEAPETEALEPAAEETAPAGTVPEEMTVVEIDGYGYIGYLSIPKIELELPVMHLWDQYRLQIAPCRHFGSTWTDDLVIAAHNYEKHFGKLKELAPGDGVTFTDMDGNITDYEVVRLETLDPNAVDAVQYSDCDLVLYTCTYNGKNRVGVFCNRTQ
nr:sortase [Oscillospiraceae bacterium]